jgi:hypothetical protein
VQAIVFPLTLMLGGLLGGALGAAATVILYVSLIPDVNKTLPADQKITTFTVDLRLPEILRQHKALFPESLMRTTFYVLFVSAAAVVFIALAITLLSVPGRP